MDLLAQIRIERECGRLPLLFARYADNGDHASLAQLFTEDCEFARPFQHGSSQIRERHVVPETGPVKTGVSRPRRHVQHALGVGDGVSGCGVRFR